MVCGLDYPEKSNFSECKILYFWNQEQYWTK